MFQQGCTVNSWGTVETCINQCHNFHTHAYSGFGWLTRLDHVETFLLTLPASYRSVFNGVRRVVIRSYGLKFSFKGAQLRSEVKLVLATEGRTQQSSICCATCSSYSK